MEIVIDKGDDVIVVIEHGKLRDRLVV
jgi:hypothetical protein